MRPQRGARSSQQQSEYQQKLLDLRRVARVVSGGRRFSFRATLVVGDQKGRVGIGIGKGALYLVIQNQLDVAVLEQELLQVCPIAHIQPGVGGDKAE